MKLLTFGKLLITERDLVKTKHLLLIAYLALEGTKERHKLAELFWEDMRGQLTTEGRRKDLKNLSVTLAQIRKLVSKEVIQDGENKGELKTPISCDAKEFLVAFNSKNHQKAWSLYQGTFLYDIEHIIKFQAFDTLYLWIMDMRESLAKVAQKTLIELAKQALEQKNFKEVGSFAELAYDLPAAPTLEPDMLSQINHLLLVGGNRLIAKTSKAINEFLEEAQLSEEALKLFLVLSLQEKADFEVARVALKLSSKEATNALEELVATELVDADVVVRAQEIAKNYFDEKPALRLPLLLDLASVTPKEKAFSVYQKVHQFDNTFGGLGFLQKARSAYLVKAWHLANKQEFQEVVKILKDIREAETKLDIEPDLEVRFLEVYALEHIANYGEMLDLLSSARFETVPRLLALKATSLMRLGSQDEGKKLAQKALEKAEDNQEGYWAKVLALNCLGNVAYNVGKPEEAISLWTRAGTYWDLLENKHRQVDTLNNIANAKARAEAPFEEIVATYNEALRLLSKCNNVANQKVHLLINLGATYVEWHKPDKAEKYYLEALNLLMSEELLEYALSQVGILYFNLGELYASQRKFVCAENYLRKAMQASLRSGDTITQAYTLVELARLKSSPELMYIALEVFAANNAEPELEIYKPTYESLLKEQLLNSFSQDRFLALRHYTKQLDLFYQHQETSDIKKANYLLNKLDEAFYTFKYNLEGELEWLSNLT